MKTPIEVPVFLQIDTAGAPPARPALPETAVSRLQDVVAAQAEMENLREHIAQHSARLEDLRQQAMLERLRFESAWQEIARQQEETQLELDRLRSTRYDLGHRLAALQRAQAKLKKEE